MVVILVTVFLDISNKYNNFIVVVCYLASVPFPRCSFLVHHCYIQSINICIQKLY